MSLTQNASPHEPTHVQAETTPVQVKVIDNGPLQVKGPVELVDHEGNSYQVGKSVFLCRCGQSRNKPFCDGSHVRAAFQATQRAPQDPQ